MNSSIHISSSSLSSSKASTSTFSSSSSEKKNNYQSNQEEDIFPTTHDSDDILDNTKLNEVDTINELIRLLGPLGIEENNSTTNSMTENSIAYNDNTLIPWPSKDAEEQFSTMKERSKLFMEELEKDILQDNELIEPVYDTSDLPNKNNINEQDIYNIYRNSSSNVHNNNNDINEDKEISQAALYKEHLDNDSDTDDNINPSITKENKNNNNKYTSKETYGLNDWFKPSCTEEQALADIQALLASGKPVTSSSKGDNKGSTLASSSPMQSKNTIQNNNVTKSHIPVNINNNHVQSNIASISSTSTSNQNGMELDDDDDDI